MSNLFKRIPKDISIGTVSGAVLTITLTIIMVILLVNSILNYMTTEIVIPPTVVEKNTSQFIDFNLHIVFPSLPCALLSIDA